MKVKKIYSNKNNYGNKRKLSTIETIYIHNTGNKGDSAENNGLYFKNNITRTSAHYFIDRKGEIIKSVPYSYIAWSVGDLFENNKSISIELCDIVGQEPSIEQIKSTRWLIKYLKKRCSNLKYIGRHYDVTGKHCPQIYVNEDKWNNFLTILNCKLERK